MIPDHLTTVFRNALTTLDAPADGLAFTHTDNPKHGDYATNIAMRLAKPLKSNPVEIAERIATAISPDETIAQVRAVRPGFINIFLTAQAKVNSLQQVAAGKITYLPYHLGKQKKLMIEFAHPNTLKLFHIGHLRNIITGESLVRLFEASHNTVIRANYQGDVGMHIAKTLWELRKMDEAGELNTFRDAPLHERIALIGKAYAAGNAAFESDEASKQEIIAINKQIYAEDPAIMPLWTETRQWSLDYFQEIYTRVYSHFDSYYFESQMAKRGVELSMQAVEKGILIKDDGAVIIPGERYGVDRRVFVNSLGLPTYEGKEMGLAEREFSEHGIIDKCIHLVTAEQSSYFAAAFKAQELMGIVPAGGQMHQTYGWVDVKGQKMSSRKGNVVEGEWLLNETKKTILANYAETDPSVAETLAVAAIKYAFLKNALQTKVEFDIGESVSITGNSGPYLLYTYVRARSVLKKAEESGVVDELTPDAAAAIAPAPEDAALLRAFYRYPEIVEVATRTLSPNLLANFLYNLASDFNLLYQKQPILKAEAEMVAYRLTLTRAVSVLIKDGLRLLGIKTVEKM
ncbi:MAG: arginine--tRNA ligase [Patescibacteria group bacterium]|nr:arginine--tRNA ligase [Patescibacteria group bacterium]